MKEIIAIALWILIVLSSVIIVHQLAQSALELVAMIAISHILNVGIQAIIRRLNHPLQPAEQPAHQP